MPSGEGTVHNKKLRSAVEVLRCQFVTAAREKRAVRATTQSSYRSSRETAARTLRDEDARLLGLLAEGQRSGSSTIDYYARR
jgi:hypothetical protein